MPQRGGVHASGGRAGYRNSLRATTIARPTPTIALTVGDADRRRNFMRRAGTRSAFSLASIER
jgi:hypothetical protein